VDVKKNFKIKGTSTEDLKKEALEVAERCKIELERLGFTIGMIVDSGNGYHIYTKVNLIIPPYKSEDEFKTSAIYNKFLYLENCLKKFDTGTIKIDSISKDIVRRVKIPGTYNVKRYQEGDNEKWLLMPKEEWRLAKILHVADKINEKQNTSVFMQLPEDKIDTASVNINLNEITPEQEETIIEQLNSILEKNVELNDLFNGKSTHLYESRSEAEIALIDRLMMHTKFSDSEIYYIMEQSKIGKWNESLEAYKVHQLKNARQFSIINKEITLVEIEKLIEKLEESTENLGAEINKILLLVPKNKGILLDQTYNAIKKKLPFIDKRTLKSTYRKLIRNKNVELLEKINVKKNVENDKLGKEKNNIVYLDDFRIEGKEDGVYKIKTEYSDDGIPHETSTKILKRKLEKLMIRV
jgi:hypothetical protein